MVNKRPPLPATSQGIMKKPFSGLVRVAARSRYFDEGLNRPRASASVPGSYISCYLLRGGKKLRRANWRNRTAGLYLPDASWRSEE